jgi:hypothetical protein
MSNIVKIITEDTEIVLSDAEHINCLFNTGEVAIDGERYEDVVQVVVDEVEE